MSMLLHPGLVLLLLPMPLHAEFAAQKAGSAELEYRVQHRSADELARLLQGLGVKVKVRGGKGLLVGGDKEALAVAQKALAQLDQAPRKVTLEFLVAEFSPGPTPDATQLSGSVADLRERVQRWEKSGRVSNLKRLKAVTPDQQKTAVQNME